MPVDLLLLGLVVGSIQVGAFALVARLQAVGRGRRRSVD